LPFRQRGRLAFQRKQIAAVGQPIPYFKAVRRGVIRAAGLGVGHAGVVYSEIKLDRLLAVRAVRQAMDFRSEQRITKVQQQTIPLPDTRS